MKKVLLVDDDTDFAQAVAFYLRAHDLAVVTASSGREGLRLARTERPDVVIMDIVMEERTEGLFALREMRRSPELKNVPVFVISSLYEQAPAFHVAPGSEWMGCDEFLAKPVDLPDLLARIRARLAAGGKAA
jgi:DNA-binding response OmpR family regulator